MTSLPNSASMLLAFLLLFALARCEDLQLSMPPYEVHENDTYLCFATELPKTAKRIVAIEPQSDMEVAHHMLLFGCVEPQHQPEDGVWECHMARPCKSGENILYGWGRNAPTLTFPNGVGYSVGGKSSINYLVLQVHYLSTRPKDDSSGIVLKLTEKPSPLTASMMAYMVGFEIPPGKKSHLVDNSCCISGFQQVTTMAFRVHTHVMGRSVYMTRTSGLFPNGTEIARNDPQLPQGFYPVEKETKIRPGENLKVTCDFNSVGKDHVVGAGHTHDDEMCNMYMMTYSEIPHFVSCSGDYSIENMEGPGGIPKDNSIVTESSVLGAWKPPGERKNASKENKSDSVGQVSGVAVAEDGSIWIIHRGDSVFTTASFDQNVFTSNQTIEEHVVMELDPKTGEVKRKWGKGRFYMPHMITVDFDGYVWIVDVGRHQVLKFDKAGQLVMELGEKMVPGNDESHFCQPTQVQILNDGRILVSDGYCNKRVVIFDKDGKYLDSIEDGDLQVVHSLAVDECRNQVFVASRQNSLLVVYDIDTKERVGEVALKSFGMLWALTKGPYGTIAALAWDENSTTTLVILDSDSQMSWEIPDVDWPHDIALGAAPMEITGPENRLFAFYVAETKHDGTSGIRKFISTPKNFSPAVEPEEPALLVTSRNKKPDDLGVKDPTTEALDSDEDMTGTAAAPETVELPDEGKSEALQSDEGHAAIKEAISASNHQKKEKEDAEEDEETGKKEVAELPILQRNKPHESSENELSRDQDKVQKSSTSTSESTSTSTESASATADVEMSTSTSKDASAATHTSTSTSSDAGTVSVGAFVSTAKDTSTSASGVDVDFASSRSDAEIVQAKTVSFEQLSDKGRESVYESGSNTDTFKAIHPEPPISPSGFNVKALMMVFFPVCALAAAYHYLKRRRSRRYQRLF
ncbi:hypothetical protein BSKO_09959 [Bryopsis sp. KO-2023]|nr:hypothetical protein BSKO_09959 [Bryopsis sp. KO-2023]